MSRTERFVFGLFLLTVGMVWTLGNFGVIDALGALRRIWPAFLILWGGLELARVRRRQESS